MKHTLQVMGILAACLGAGCLSPQELFIREEQRLIGSWQIIETRPLARNRTVDHPIKALHGKTIKFHSDFKISLVASDGIIQERGTWFLYQDEDDGEDCEIEHHVGISLPGFFERHLVLLGQVDRRGKRRMNLWVNSAGNGYRVRLAPK